MAAFLAAIYSGLVVSVGSMGALRGAWLNRRVLGAWLKKQGVFDQEPRTKNQEPRTKN
jgi:hypothetical protein